MSGNVFKLSGTALRLAPQILGFLFCKIVSRSSYEANGYLESNALLTIYCLDLPTGESSSDAYTYAVIAAG